MSDIFDLFRQIAKPAEKSSAPTYIVAGLGNPGSEYEYTRHNAGFLAVDYFSGKTGAKVNRLKYKALVGEAVIGGASVLLMKPQTYMNHSGEAISEAARFYKIAPDHVIVLVDDVYLAPGRVRIRKNGSAGGHNGLKSIIEHLGTDAFPRVRIGVGDKPSPDADMPDWVLGKIPKADQAKMFECFTWIPDILEMMVSGDADGAMGKYNGKTAEGGR